MLVRDFRRLQAIGDAVRDGDRESGAAEAAEQ
jgi:hypothetical protein